MKKLIFLFAALAFACSESEDPQPAKVAQDLTGARDNDDDQDIDADPCQVTSGINNHTSGVTVSISAELKGCFDDVVLKAETRKPSESTLSMFRKPSACDKTDMSIAFASKGETLYFGLFPCGPDMVASNGRAYTVTVAQGDKVTTVKGKVGGVIKYIVQ